MLHWLLSYDAKISGEDLQIISCFRARIDFVERNTEVMLVRWKERSND